MKEVYVVSYHAVDSFGGFDWYHSLADARAAYHRELTEVWGTEDVAVRLVAMEVEAVGAKEITDELDERIDELEVTAPAIAEGRTR